ncbi:hypothetical protein, conserved [Babesia bigemina]|uniref:Derlin n=1 Tax=Babesia bigemina TaxID=5866 RepID=A0A061D963_BABBI|nr:hypothetical protein, conserved [Babesia bigemina]CDR95444.1 hypothetical protein, conserved [Babesia bigemina]|eukprot:XP_012767630.1 hypothetical protein, conserved [Babesia bigemina]
MLAISVFLHSRWILRALFLCLAVNNVNVYCAKVSDLTPRVGHNNAIIPRFHHLERPSSSLRDLKRSVKHVLDRCAETPVSSSLGATSLLISSSVWIGLVRPESLMNYGSRRPFLNCCIPLASAFLIPELNGSGVLNLLSFYVLLRQSEDANGSAHLLRRLIYNLLTTTVVSGVFGMPPDFHKFSRAFTVANALENPNHHVQFQGVISMKQWHLPLALLLADYLMTLRMDQAIEGSKATIAGAATYILCNKI